MKPIQFILVSLLILLLITYLGRRKSRLLDQAFVLFLAGLGVALVLVPDWANLIAHWVGVGRGADLLTYLGLLTVGFVLLKFYIKMGELERCLTEISRDSTIKNATFPPKA